MTSPLYGTESGYPWEFNVVCENCNLEFGRHYGTGVPGYSCSGLVRQYFSPINTDLATAEDFWKEFESS